MRVLITGSSGFLGHSIIKLIHEKALNWELQLPKHGELNLISQEDVRYYIKFGKPDMIIHLAANCGGIGKNMVMPATLCYDNLQMGMNILHYAQTEQVKKVIMLASTCMYPKITPIPFREEDIWKGYPEETNSYYGIAKRAIMSYGQALSKQHGMNIINLVPANLYGPYDHFDLEYGHVIPVLIRKFVDAIKNETSVVECWGTGSPTREFLYVDDCAEAILLALERHNGSDPINIGTGQSVSIKNLTELIVELTGYKGIINWDKSKPDGQPKRELDTCKAKTLFGFKAKTSLRDGLEKTIDYYCSISGWTKIS